MSYQREELVRDIESLHIDVLRKEDEKYSHIPFQTTLSGRNAVVYGHNGLIEEAQGSYIIDIEPDEVLEAFVKISVANSVMRKRLEHAKVNQVVRFYTPLSSPDSIYRKINDDIEEGGIDTDSGQFLLSALLGDNVVSDVARINAIRLAKNVSISSESVSRNLEISGKTSLNSLLSKGRESYDQVLMAFGNDSPIERANLFAGSIQESLIALAFPMDDLEADRLLDLMPE